jgi:hypothetical protein
LRENLRDTDSRAAAAKRAAEILDTVTVDDFHDDFRAPAPPDGWTYEWKRSTVYNQEDPSYQVELRRTGWEPVDVNRHPDTMPIGYKGVIARRGMILMERPKEVTDVFRAKDKKAAIDLVRNKEEQIRGAPQGSHFSDGNSVAKERLGQKIGISYSPLTIPES